MNPAKKNKKTSKSDVLNKKKVVILIDDDLSPKQEAEEVFKQLMDKKLLGDTKNTYNQKLLEEGSKVKVKHLQTEIVIKRILKEKHIPLLDCPVCRTQYEENLGFKYYTNIGGFVKTKKTCSENCADIIIKLSPSRFSKKKSKIKVSNFFNLKNEKSNK